MDHKESAAGVCTLDLLNIPFAHFHFHFHFQLVVRFQNQPLAACGNGRFPSMVLVFQIARDQNGPPLTFSIYI